MIDRLGILLAVVSVTAAACSSGPPEPTLDNREPAAAPQPAPPSLPRKYLLEQIGDAAVVQLYADGFEKLPLNEKVLVWHLGQAAIAGRDIFYDQRYRYNLEMRDLLEEVLIHADGIAPSTLAQIQHYTKLFWINTGPYNHLTARKFTMAVAPPAFAEAVRQAAKNGARFRLGPAESLDALIARMQPLFFDAAVDPMVTQKAPKGGKDILKGSSNNLYSGVSMADLEGFTERYGLNSRLVKQNGELREEVYKVGGRYDREIRQIIGHLESALQHATPTMRTALETLVQWYRTGEDADRRAYDIAWVTDKDSPIDTVNGFIEVYMDPRGIKGSWEGLVSYVNEQKTIGIQKLAADAQWFEDRMPWDPKYRKPGVQGITGKAIDVVIVTGDSGPIAPLGINLPNDQQVREQHGSKSVSLSNVTEAYDRSTPDSLRQEFAWDGAELTRSTRWLTFSDELVTNMHEAIGHASGRVSEKVGANPARLLKEHYSALEEGRCDLVALYFIADPRLAHLGILSAEDQDDIVHTQYDAYTRNAMVQLRRLREGTQIEDDHMRNRQMIVRWLMENTKAIETRQREGKTFFVMVNREAFRTGVGRLLAEVQRIKAEGDYQSAKQLFERHGVHFDPKLRDEAVRRVDQLHLPSYSGFVMPKLEPRRGSDGTITDVRISYPMDLTAQMLEFSGKRAPRQ